MSSHVTMLVAHLYLLPSMHGRPLQGTQGSYTSRVMKIDMPLCIVQEAAEAQLPQWLTALHLGLCARTPEAPADHPP